jgi:hypothetical protein
LRQILIDVDGRLVNVIGEVRAGFLGAFKNG